MKKFITIAPRQNVKIINTKEGPKPSNPDPYIAANNTKLKCDLPGFYPILYAINGYASEGEEIEVLVLTAEYSECENSYIDFQNDCKELCDKLEVVCNFIKISIPDAESIDKHLYTFQRLIENIQDYDELYICATYGTKPTPIAEFMALNYAYRALDNVSIECIVYGGKDFISGEKKIYDITELFLMDQIVNELSKAGHSNIINVIKSIMDI